MADIAIFRINYKSDFILTLQSDAGWMTPFCIKFWTGAPSQAYYAYYDGMSYTHCTPVDGEPTKLLVQFDDHHLPIGDLKFQIGYHFTVADFPTSVEDEVINQASVIIEVDDAPAQVMLDFNGETAPEIEFSLPAYANEAQRIANEQARIAAEEQRIANEQARISAEETRQANEQQRINAEAERVSDFASMKTESEAATAAANIAATLANEKAQLADDKAALAQAAATLANAKAQLAADKAALAQAAATLANEKAALAQQKAEYAQEQGDAAKTEAETAHALNEEVRDDEEARDQAEQIRQQQETARQQAESQRVTDFNAQMQQQQTAYADAEAVRDTAFDEAETERDAKVDAKVADITNLQAQIGYFVCDTGASVAAKTIAATGYALTKGGNIRIKMTNANTVGNATLNINSTGAKPLFYEGARASSTNTWVADDILEIYYDGTNYQAKNVSPAFKTGEKVNSVGVDDEPTAGSDNVVKSGGVWNLNRAIVVADTIYNGTPNNHRNDNRVRTSPIRVINGTHIILYTDRPLSAEGNYYVYPKYYKDKNGTVILNVPTPSPNYRIQEVPYGAYTTEICFGEVTAEGENITLRTSDFEGYNIYTIAFPSELFERISTLESSVDNIESSVDNIESLISTISTFLDNFEKEIRGGYVFDTIERSYVPSKNTSKYSSITFGLMKDHTYRFTFASESSFSGTQLSAKIINNDTSSKIKDLATNLLSNGSWDGSAKSIVYTHSADRVGSVAVGSYGSTNLTIEGTGEIKVTIEDITISNLVNEDTPSEETSILDLNPAKEYLTKIKTLRRHDFNQSAPNDVTFPFILLHFSDIHGAVYNMQRIKEWWDEYSNYIDGVINTGDNVPTKWTGDISYLIKNGGDKILNVIGNHDVADPAVSSNMYNGNVPHTDIYAKFMSGLMDDTELGVIRPANASTYGYCFYYKDFTNRGNVQGQNLRLIVTDSVIQDRQWLANAAHDRSYYEAELAWLENVLADARANNLTVIIASHYGPQINTQIHDAKGFSFVDNSVSDSYGIHVAFHQKVQDFIDAGGKFVCWLCGHRHLDAFGTVDGYPQQIAITVTTAAYSVYRNLHYYQVDRAQDDKSADAFNMIGIDTEHKLLRILRIGCNYDGYFRPCDAITVDYSNLNNIKVWA